MQIITTISLWLAILFYTPSIFISILYIFIGNFLLKTAFNKYDYHGGYRSKIALKLLARGYKIQDDVSFDTLSYATQIKEKEIIMKAIRADKAYPFIAKEDRKKTIKDSDKTIFNVKFLSPQQSASLGDQIFDVRGAGSSRKERLMSGTQELVVLKQCLTGWENYKADDWTPENKHLEEFDASKMDEMLEMISPEVRSEIAEFARGQSEPDEGESEG